MSGPTYEVDGDERFEAHWKYVQRVIVALLALALAAGLLGLFGPAMAGVILRSALVYVFLTIVLRVATRRIIRSATPLDMVLVFVFGGLGVSAVMQDQKGLAAPLLAIATMGLMHMTVFMLKRSFPKVGCYTEGTPVIVYRQGEWRQDRLDHLRVERRDVIAEARQKGLSMDEVALVVIEHNGGISVVQEHDGVARASQEPNAA